MVISRGYKQPRGYRVMIGNELAELCTSALEIDPISVESIRKSCARRYPRGRLIPLIEEECLAVESALKALLPEDGT